MSNIYETPLANLYQSLIDNGSVSPVEVSSNFRYPSKLLHLPTMATNVTIVGDRLSGGVFAKLVSNSSGDK